MIVNVPSSKTQVLSTETHVKTGSGSGSQLCASGAGCFVDHIQFLCVALATDAPSPGLADRQGPS